MAQFLNDTFTGTDNSLLISHTGETGAGWSNNVGVFKIQANRVWSTQAASNLFRSSGTPVTAEYDVTAIINVPATQATESEGGPAGRIDTTGAVTCYVAFYRTNAQNVSLQKVVAGVFTQLGSFSVNLSDATDHTITLKIRNATKKVIIDGVERISSTDNVITSAGKAGIFNYNAGTATSGTHLSSIQGSDPVSTVNQISETDTPQAITRNKHLSFAIQTEADSVFSVAKHKTLTIGQAIETEFAQHISRNGKFINAGLATETDSVLTATKAKRKAVGQDLETDTAPIVIRFGSKVYPIAQVEEFDLVWQIGQSEFALPMTAVKTPISNPTDVIPVGTAIEIDSALTLFSTTQSDVALHIIRKLGRLIPVAAATVTNTAQSVRKPNRRAPNQTLETDAALAISIRRTRTLGITTEAEVSQTAKPARVKLIGIASETDTLQTIIKISRRLLAQIQEVDLPLAISRSGHKFQTVAQATQATTVFSITPIKKPSGLVYGVPYQRVLVSFKNQKTITLGLVTDDGGILLVKRATTINTVRTKANVLTIRKTNSSITHTTSISLITKPVKRAPSTNQITRVKMLYKG